MSDQLLVKLTKYNRSQGNVLTNTMKHKDFLYTSAFDKNCILQVRVFLLLAPEEIFFGQKHLCTIAYLHQCDKTQGNNSTQALLTKTVCFGCEPSCFSHLKDTIFEYYCFPVFRFINFPRPALSNQLTPDIICHAEGSCRTDFLCIVRV